ncbi:Reticulon-4-interacting protein 1 [Paramyrothecium foliicola]|nr:Reticulon-4-interacting protein 1 [Paramyrothecium foliicola]
MLRLTFGGGFSSGNVPLSSHSGVGTRDKHITQTTDSDAFIKTTSSAQNTTANMRAWTFTHGGYPQALQESDLPADNTPLKPTEVLVRTKAASINPIDSQLMGFPLLASLPTSVLPANKGVGEDFSGVVEEAGTDSGFCPGDEVFGIIHFFPTGSLSETIRIDTNNHGRAIVLPKPVDWNFEKAAAVPLVWLTASTLIAYVGPYISESKKLVVLGGSSSCGIYVSYIAKQRGWKVLATCSGKKAEFARSMGADDVVDYTTTNVPDRVRAFGPDAIIDCVGGTECVGLAKRYVTVVGDKSSTDRLGMGGSYTYIFNPQMMWRAVLGKLRLGPSYTCINLKYNDSWLKEAISLPKDKIHIDSIFEFSKVREAFERLNTGRTQGKVIIRVAP